MNLTTVSTKLQKCSRFLSVNKRSIARFSSKSEEPIVPRNPLQDVYSASQQKANGVVYDKKPFKLRLEAGRNYSWCLCGQSKNQPLCDGTHKNVFLKVTLKPIRFVVPETKEYWLCNCKQTSNRPFCDGTHKKPEVQELKR
ncbi:CDGSH iron-sulfur domain-containing protein 3, mitochondrial [Leptopilina heterotoma]|uniref:CDGSH iron-sulfur domain-containing protein 3, mitochondrial n=1 Tax=Leptopilina heterotoma TaxID=63436 RepID=UPI001CAA1F47|nr:CDGSH iron-sulfur domain-containing protein 3, mitochondrial [Leptopilina heterotoma]